MPTRTCFGPRLAATSTPVEDALSPKQVLTPKVPSWYEWDVTARTQQWINDSTGNFGWLIKAQIETSHLQDQFYQSDTANAAFRPKLVISDLVPRKAGDINGDDYVNVGDLQALVGSWAKLPSERGFEPWADINADGYVNVGDLQVLVAHWGE